MLQLVIWVASKPAAQFPSAICTWVGALAAKASELTQPIPTAGILWDDPLLGIFHHEALAGTDVLLVTGGVSVGDFDFTKSTLLRLAIEQRLLSPSYLRHVLRLIYREGVERLNISSRYLRKGSARSGRRIAK